MPKPSSPQPPRLRIQELGSSLRAALIATLAHLGGSSLRPVTLAKSLKIDDSLSARLLRSVRASDPLSSLRELPAPQGIRLFLQAAAKHNIPPETLQAAEDAVSQLELLLAELPLGRASLNTAIDGWLPSGRARAESSNKQAVFKALSQTLGFTVDTACFATAIQPSATGDTCDALTMIAMDGIRRLREGAPILLFGHTWQPKDPSVPASQAPLQYTETLDGEREFTDVRKMLLSEVGDSSTLPLRLIERANHTRVVLDSASPPLNVPVTAAVASIARNAYARFQTDSRAAEVFTNACKVPIRVFVQDFFIHEDVFPTFNPNILARMDNLSPDPSARDEELIETERVELDIDLARIGWGFDRIGIKEWAGYEPALSSAFRRAGWDPRRFRVYRCYIRYPYPFINLSTWFDLPRRP